MNKKGQFFLIAAAVIVMIIAGLGVIYTSTKAPQEDLAVYDLSKELNYESAQVIDNGIFNSLTPEQLEENVRKLSSYYAESNPTSDILVVYGTHEQITIFNYNQTQLGSVGLGVGGGTIISAPIITPDLTIEHRSVENKKIQIKIKGSVYDFNLKRGQNLYLAIKKEKNDETIVATE